MASITVTGSCYWGGPEYSWSGLARTDTVKLNAELQKMSQNNLSFICLG